MSCIIKLCKALHGIKNAAGAFHMHRALLSLSYQKNHKVYNQQCSLLHCDSSQGLARLIEAYRQHGHKAADINPLYPPDVLTREELDPASYGLSLEQHVESPDNTSMSVKDLIDQLQQTYCGKISIEASDLECIEEKEWLHACFSEIQSKPIDAELKQHIFKVLTNSQTFDQFLAMKFPTLKRYGCEGAESMLVFVEKCIQSLSSSGVQQLVIGMPHRGRNNLLVGSLNYPIKNMFRKIKGLSEFPEPALKVATGDVLSHLGISTDLSVFGSDKKIHVNLLSNSSFLESINPVAMGKCRGRQQTVMANNSEIDKSNAAVCLLMHGDASFAGQGIVMECFNMANLPDFEVAGTIHLIVNNQVGFTTPSEYGRSSHYASDIGKLIRCPVIHVNGNDPEEVLKAAEIAVKYQQKYKKDIIIDMLCYRLRGHNELDDPTFTQPLMYDVISDQPSVPELYAERLKKLNLISNDAVETSVRAETERYNELLKECEAYEPSPSYLDPDSPWGQMRIPSSNHLTGWDTGCHADELRFVGAKSVDVHEEFVSNEIHNKTMHEHLQKSHAEARIKKLQSSSSIDWALAETFAFGSLLNQGFSVRLCGQDVGRGTFSHRHMALTCRKQGVFYYPLNHLMENQAGTIEVASSLLSEEAVLGFEYGMSIENPKRLCVWEAQFGDFFTGAQIMVDTFVMAGEAKWMYQSGIVILLPHGYDGAGPEHSSCRIERFLQSTNSSETDIDGDNVNVSVCHPTTAAQYFHLLRRQMIRNYRKPLIVASPKMLLRYNAAMSPLSDFIQGTRFLPVIDDKSIKAPQTVKKVICCSGKHYYILQQERVKLIQSGYIGESDVAIIRLEELCPFPTAELHEVLDKFSSAKSYIWAQEEPRNMGAWSFVVPRFENLFGIKLRYAGRPALATPAVGIGVLHQEQANQLLKDAFK